MACSARAISAAMVLRPHVAIRSQLLDCAVFSGLDLAPGNLWRPTETTLTARLGRLPRGTTTKSLMRSHRVPSLGWLLSLLDAPLHSWCGLLLA
jgi:hypothetical protein